MRGPGHWLRRTRTGLLGASACLLLGAASHSAAGGRLPDAAGMGLLFAALTVLCTVLFGARRRRFDVTTLVLGATQFGLHLAFHTLSMAGTAGQATAHAPQAHHAMAGHMAGAHAGMDPAAVSGGGHVMSPAMTLAHALATLGTSVCVIYGERVLRHLVALLAPALPLTAAPALATPPERPRPPYVAPLPARFGALLARACPRRGPPVTAV
ncbi:hypothetical protein [Streptomyces erythrochromogenes]|uniref:hypothetical protein n=1 Tax=Streptomyces erythrochromogenes TaxID=285574 RepID=UPI003830751C